MMLDKVILDLSFSTEAKDQLLQGQKLLASIYVTLDFSNIDVSDFDISDDENYSREENKYYLFVDEREFNGVSDSRWILDNIMIEPTVLISTQMEYSVCVDFYGRKNLTDKNLFSIDSICFDEFEQQESYNVYIESITDSLDDVDSVYHNEEPIDDMNLTTFMDYYENLPGYINM